MKTSEPMPEVQIDQGRPLNEHNQRLMTKKCIGFEDGTSAGPMCNMQACCPCSTFSVFFADDQLLPLGLEVAVTDKSPLCNSPATSDQTHPAWLLARICRLQMGILSNVVVWQVKFISSLCFTPSKREIRR